MPANCNALPARILKIVAHRRTAQVKTRAAVRAPGVFQPSMSSWVSMIKNYKYSKCIQNMHNSTSNNFNLSGSKLL